MHEVSKKVNMNKQQVLRKERRAKIKVWKLAVLSRAGHKCEWCGATRYVQCHHIINRKLTELRYDEDNGIALCSRCHTFQTGMAAHHNPIRIFIWLYLNRPTSLERLITWTMTHNANLEMV